MNLFADTRYPNVMRKVGTAAVLFFLVKGLLWLAAPFVFYFAL